MKKKFEVSYLTSRRYVPYFDFENQFSPSDEILSYSFSLKKLRHNDMQDVESHRQKVMSKCECMYGVTTISVVTMLHHMVHVHWQTIYRIPCHCLQ